MCVNVTCVITKVTYNELSKSSFEGCRLIKDRDECLDLVKVFLNHRVSSKTGYFLIISPTVTSPYIVLLCGIN